MPMIWTLRDRLRERGITSASEISRIIREVTGTSFPYKPSATCLTPNPKWYASKRLRRSVTPSTSG